MANFYAKYPGTSATVIVGNTVTANQGNPPWTVTGTGVSGTADPGVLTVQGIAGATPVPVSGTLTATNPSVGATGAAVPADATYIGMIVAGNLTGLPGTVNGLKTDGSAVTQPISGTVAVSNFPATQPISGTVAVSNFPATQPISAAALPLPAGAATEATLAAQSAKLPATLGQHAMAASLSVAIASDQSAVPVTIAAAPLAPTGRAAGILANHSYAGGGGVTTAAYTQIIASTASAINQLFVFDSSGSAIIIAVGAAASEVDTLYVPPGGTNYPFDIAIPAGTRLSVKALDVNASAGQLIWTGLK